MSEGVCVFRLTKATVPIEIKSARNTPVGRRCEVVGQGQPRLGQPLLQGGNRGMSGVIINAGQQHDVWSGLHQYLQNGSVFGG